MEDRLTKTFQTEMQIALSGVYCALSANTLEENIHVNQRAKFNEIEVNEQESHENIPGEYKEVDNSYSDGKRQDTPEYMNIALKPQNYDDTKKLSNLSNPNSISDDENSLSPMKPTENTVIDNNPTTRTNLTNRPIPVPRTTTSGIDKKASNSRRLEVSRSESSLTDPKEAWNEEQDRTKSWNEETHVKQSREQLNDPRNNGLTSHIQRVKQLRGS